MYVPAPGQGQVAEPRHQERGDQRCGQDHNADSKAKYAIVHSSVQVQGSGSRSGFNLNLTLNLTLLLMCSLRSRFSQFHQPFARFAVDELAARGGRARCPARWAGRRKSLAARPGSSRDSG